MSAPDFRFERRGGRSLGWAALGASLAFIAVAALQDSRLLGWSAVILVVPFLIWSVFAAPTSGVAISEGVLSWWEEGRTEETPLSQIGKAVGKVAGTIVLHMRDGSQVVLQPKMLPPGQALLEVLEVRGVAIEREKS